MEMLSLEKELSNNSYPGRGIIPRPFSKRNEGCRRLFHYGQKREQQKQDFCYRRRGIRTEAFDPTKLTDPSLIIYAPVRVLGNKTIVTNGDQTDTIYEGHGQTADFRAGSEKP